MEFPRSFSCFKKAEYYQKKKTTYYKERSEAKRAEFLKAISGIEKERLVYVDESGIDKYLHRTHARAARGKKVHFPIRGRKFARESFVAAKVGSKIIAPFCYTGTCNRKLFNYWVAHHLVPELKLGQVIIMDNAIIHISDLARKLI